MLNERGYERETNCSGMLRTYSKLPHAQRVHRACCICATLMSLQQNGHPAHINLVYNNTVLNVQKKVRLGL